MANNRGVGAYETVKGWFRDGFWRTNHRQDRLFLLFLIVLCALIGLGACSPLPRDDLPRHRTETTTPLANRTDVTTVPAAAAARDVDAAVARHRRGSPPAAGSPPARHNRNQKGGLRARGNRKAHTISPRNTMHQRPGACFEEVAAKAYLADTVFDGKARSRSPVKNGVYNVTFVVQSVFKGSEAGFTIRSPVRLQFAEKREGDAECPHSGLVKSNIRRGGKYVVFVDKVGPHSFVARGEPAIRSRLNVQAVKDILCPNCVRKPQLSGLTDVAARTSERLRLVCRTRGNPLPLLHWYKDGARLHKSRDVKIRNKKRRTTLVIGKLALADAGKYECRALSVTGATDRISALVAVTADVRQDNTTPAWRVPRPCPIEHFCMNEGLCTYFETVGELSCSCAEGYKGTRCEEKDVYNRANGKPRRKCRVGSRGDVQCATFPRTPSGAAAAAAGRRSPFGARQRMDDAVEWYATGVYHDV